jgi:hypothetical protein
MHTRRTLLAALPASILAGAGLLCAGTVRAAAGPVVTLRGVDYLHRWSAVAQHEFTPADQADLQRWRDMVTVNVHRSVADGDQLAELANGVLGNYQRHGRILRTASLPRTAQRPAEHFIAAALSAPGVVEAAFARCVLADGVGYAIVASHRAHGEQAGAELAAWLRAQGTAHEQALMGLQRWPTAVELARLPVSRRG